MFKRLDKTNERHEVADLTVEQIDALVRARLAPTTPSTGAHACGAPDTCAA